MALPREPAGATPRIDHFFVAGSHSFWRLVVASSASEPFGPKFWPTPLKRILPLGRRLSREKSGSAVSDSSPT